jgi:hypothetical protein
MTSQFVHTRQITDRLCYQKLVSKGLIPDVMPLLNHYPEANKLRRHPPFVYKNNSMSAYGQIFDYIIRAGFRAMNPDITFELGSEPIAKISQDSDITKTINTYHSSKNLYDLTLCSYQLVEQLLGIVGFDKKDICGFIGNITNIMKNLNSKFQYYAPYLKGNIKYNFEIKQEHLFGHPDIVCDNVVFDIKTTSSFNQMAEKSFIQLLAYYAQIKPTQPELESIGFILPNQRDIAIFDISTWDSSSFLQFLLRKAHKRIKNPKTVEQMPKTHIKKRRKQSPKTKQCKTSNNNDMITLTNIDLTVTV